MTGYTVHPGTSKKFSSGWDRIFGDNEPKTAKGKQQSHKTEKKAPKAKSQAKSGKNQATKGKPKSKSK